MGGRLYHLELKKRLNTSTRLNESPTYWIRSDISFWSQIFTENLKLSSCCRLRLISCLQVKEAPAVQVSPKIENGCDELADAFHICFVVSDWRLLVCTFQIMMLFSDNKTIKPLYWKSITVLVFKQLCFFLQHLDLGVTYSQRVRCTIWNLCFCPFNLIYDACVPT